MTVDELISRLEEYRDQLGGDSEVRLMTQQNWPFENRIFGLATRRRTLTATGIARLIERGIRANFAPENQEAEIDRLAELFADMAMSRATDGELAELAGESKKASEDARWLDAIACELDR
ncbi:MAG: hypothetical protein GXX96_31420 [Planctomycetaceae bacterium]|nr:hypothetical protein [Planctomycetaceae bacterium]